MAADKSTETVRKSDIDLIKAELFEKDGKIYMRDGHGLVFSRDGEPVPYSNMLAEANAVRESISTMFPELMLYLVTLTPIFTFKFKTFCTGHGYIAINPYFWDALKEKSLEKAAESEEMAKKFKKYTLCRFVYLHEIYHQLFNHLREGEIYKDSFPGHGKQNRAMDYSINGLIEKFYGMAGATKAARGLINPAWNGKPWTEIYTLLRDDEDEKENGNNPWQEVVNHRAKVKNPDDNGGTPQLPTPPQKIEKKYTDDFKEGYYSQHPIIKHIMNDVIDNGGTIDDAIKALKDYAMQNIGADIFESAGTHDYNEGVKAAWADAINKLIDTKSKIGADGTEGEPGEQDQIKGENLRNAIDDDMFDLPDDGSGEGGDDEDGDSQQNGEEGKKGKQGNDPEDGGDDNGEGGQDGSQQSGEPGGDSGTDGSERGQDGPQQSGGNGGHGGEKGNRTDKGGDSPSDGETGDGDLDNIESEDPDSDSILDVIAARDLQAKDKEVPAEEAAEALKKHLDVIAKAHEENGDPEVPGLVKGINPDKLFGIEKHETKIDWREILERFLAVSVEEEYDDLDIDSILDTPGVYNGRIDYEGNLRDVEGIRHIVIGLDNSGSVFGAGRVPSFLGELVHVLDDGIDEDCVVDFIQFESGITKCTRIVHTEGESISEVRQVSSAHGGGTNYYDTMRQMSILMDGWDGPERKGLRPEFIEPTVQNSNGEVLLIQPAACSIIFTDDDFFYGSTYDEINTDKLLIFIVGEPRRVDGNSAMYAPCINFIKPTEWSNGSVSESLNEAFFDDDNIDDEIEAIAQHTIDSTDDYDSLKYRMDDLKDVLGGDVKLEVKNGAIHADGTLVVDSLIDLRDIIVDGSLVLTGIDDGIVARLPKAVNGIVLFLNCSELSYKTYEDFEIYGMKEKHYINCTKKNPTSKEYEFPDFTDDWAFAYMQGYTEKFIKEYTEKYNIPVNFLRGGLTRLPNSKVSINITYQRGYTAIDWKNGEMFVDENYYGCNHKLPEFITINKVLGPEGLGRLRIFSSVKTLRYFNGMPNAAAGVEVRCLGCSREDKEVNGRILIGLNTYKSEHSFVK